MSISLNSGATQGNARSDNVKSDVTSAVALDRRALKKWQARDRHFDLLFDRAVAHQLDGMTTRQIIALDSAFHMLSEADICELKFRLGEVEISRDVLLQKLGRLPPGARRDVLWRVAGTLDIEKIESPRDIERLIITATRARALLDFTSRIE